MKLRVNMCQDPLKVKEKPFADENRKPVANHSRGTESRPSESSLSALRARKRSKPASEATSSKVRLDGIVCQ